MVLDELKETLLWYRAGDTRQLAQSALATLPLMDACLLPGEAALPYVRGRLVRSLLRWAFDQLRPQGALDGARADWQRYTLLTAYYQKGVKISEAAAAAGFSEAALYSKRNAKGQSRLDSLVAEVGEVLAHAADQAVPAQLWQYALEDRYYQCTTQQQHALRFLAVFRQAIVLDDSVAWFDQDAMGPQTTLAELITHCLVQETQDAYQQRVISLLPAVRAWCATQSSADERRRWHGVAAMYYQRRHDELEAAWHWYGAGERSKAAQLVITHGEAFIQAQRGPQLAELVATFTRTDVPDEIWAQLRLVAGKIAELLHNVDAAEAEYLAALAATKNDRRKGEVYYHLARTVEAKNIEEALAYYTLSIALVEAPGTEPALPAAAYTHLAWVYLYARPDTAKAETYLRRAAQWLQQIVPPAAVLQANWDSAWSYLYANLGLGDQALHHQIQALLTAYESGQYESQMNILHNIGLYYRERGNPSLGLDYLQRSRQLAQQIGDREMEGRCLNTMGGCHFYLQALPQALEAYHQAYDLLTHSGHRPLLAAACWNLAEAYAVLDQRDLARRYFAEGLAILPETPLPELQAEFQTLAQRYDFLCTSCPPVPAPSRWHQVAAWIKQHGAITNQEYCEITRLSHRQAVRDLQEWVEQQRLQQVGSGRGTRYLLALP